MRARTGPAPALRLGAPAAVIGALAAVLTVAPADADDTGPSLRAAAQSAPSAALAFRHAPTPASTAQHARAAHAAGVPRAADTPSWIVKPGDTVSAIAARHGLRTADVLAWNGLSWQSVIRPGQILQLIAPVASAPNPPAAPAPGSGLAHTVVAGDTVYAIAKRYRTTVAAIIAENGLSGSALIHPGQKLRIGGPAPAASPAPQLSTPSPAPAPAPAPGAGASGATAHTVVAGDTLFGIAQRLGTTVGALLTANGLGEGAIIYPGQVLRLTASAPVQRSTALDAAQTANATRIVAIGRELGVPDRGIAIALATAMVESSMRNIDHGDRDSLGLFQQRPSQGWGTPEEIMDADRSIRVFYGGRHDPNGSRTIGLLDLPGWETMPFTQAAQAVQISAYPDRYGMWEQQAHLWLAGL